VTKGQKKRLKLKELYGDQCFYCSCVLNFNPRRMQPNSATIEHLIAAYESPTFTKSNKLDNLRLACRRCNNKRAHNDTKTNFIILQRHAIIKLETRLSRWEFIEDSTKKRKMLKNLADLKRKLYEIETGQKSSDFTNPQGLYCAVNAGGACN
jgi:hypothetical protein